MFNKKKSQIGLIITIPLFILILSTVIFIDRTSTPVKSSINKETVIVEETTGIPNIAEEFNKIVKKYNNTESDLSSKQNRINDYNTEEGYIDNSEESDETSETSIASYDTYTVQRVVDGDTFIIIENNEEVRVRMIGIDTPESVNSDMNKNCKYGKVASKYTTKLLSGKVVKIETDEKEYDVYGRKLAYVYLNNTFVNLDLVEKGYAISQDYKPNTKYSEKIREAQIKAQKKKIGMWSDKVTKKDCNLKEEYYIY